MTERQKQERRNMDRGCFCHRAGNAVGDTCLSVKRDQRIPNSDRRVAQRRKAERRTDFIESGHLAEKHCGVNRRIADRRAPHSSGAASKVATLTVTEVAKASGVTLDSHWEPRQYLPAASCETTASGAREQIGRIMHESWSRTKRAQGFHGPRDICPNIERGTVNYPCIGLCDKFHADLIPWEALPDKQKDINRHAFDAVLESGLFVLAATPGQMPSCHACGTIMVGLCPKCGASTGCASIPRVTPGIERIAAERQRQIEAEGWTPEHDDAHSQNELIRAALCYAAHPLNQFSLILKYWPWEPQWWKPSPDQLRNLEKAGALIAAEIDRLQRLANRPDASPAEEGKGK